jgi:hypothetical protein
LSPLSAAGATSPKQRSSAGLRARKRMRSWWATSAPRSLPREASLTGSPAASSQTSGGLLDELAPFPTGVYKVWAMLGIACLDQPRRSRSACPGARLNDHAFTLEYVWRRCDQGRGGAHSRTRPRESHGPSHAVCTAPFPHALASPTESVVATSKGDPPIRAPADGQGDGKRLARRDYAPVSRGLASLVGTAS